MKLFSFLAIAVLLVSCSYPQPKVVGKLNGIEYTDYSLYYDAKFSSLKSPIILIGKDKFYDYWGVTVQDATGEILTIGNMIPLANNIGASRSVGDTIK